MMTWPPDHTAGFRDAVRQPRLPAADPLDTALARVVVVPAPQGPAPSAGPSARGPCPWPGSIGPLGWRRLARVGPPRARRGPVGTALARPAHADRDRGHCPGDAGRC